MINFQNLSNEEIRALIKKAKKELIQRNKPKVRITKSYKKNIVKAKSLKIKIQRLLANTQNEVWQEKNKVSAIKESYKLKNLSQKTGTQLAKIIRKYYQNMQPFEKHWKKHYEKAKNAIEYLYDKETAKQLIKELRTKVYKKAKAEFLLKTTEMMTGLTQKMTETNYLRMFDATVKQYYPEDTEKFIGRLVEGGYNEEEIRQSIENYQKTGSINALRQIDRNKVFEKSLRNAVKDLSPDKKNIFLGGSLNKKSYLDLEALADIFL